MNPNLLPVVVLGGGGHASVLVDILRQQQREILAVVSPQEILGRAVFNGLAHWHSDEQVLSHSPDEVLLVNGVGSVPGQSTRQRIGEQFSMLGYRFESVISPHALVSEFASLAEGVQVLPGAIIQAGTTIDGHSIVNSRAVVEHDCQLGKYVHIAPGAVLCGQVIAGQGVFVGAGATILPGVELKTKAIVGAAALVNRNLASGQIAPGVRAVVKDREQKQVVV